MKKKKFRDIKILNPCAAEAKSIVSRKPNKKILLSFDIIFTLASNITSTVISRPGTSTLASVCECRDCSAIYSIMYHQATV
uniref:Uncharacterized protein n=1 Tax=Trichogramma kaykai TaxID=54128 RepID=A0ABD2VYG2_9HYME